MRFFINTSFDPAFNLALEELLFKEFPEELFMLWRNRSAVIVGKNQNTLAEVDHHFAEANDIAVVRRITGGGAVYHDLGNVNYSLLVQERQPGPDSFARFAKPVVEALQKMGINAAFSGRNDIEVDGKKISGSAQCCFQNRTLFHGTLLFEINMELLSKVLTPSIQGEVYLQGPSPGRNGSCPIPCRASAAGALKLSSSLSDQAFVVRASVHASPQSTASPGHA